MAVTNVPTSINDPQLRNFLQQLKNTLMSVEAGQRALSNAVSGIGQGPPGGEGEDNPFGDGTIPNAPYDLIAVGMFGAILLRWSGTEQYIVSSTEIWRSETDDISTATMVGTANGRIYTDYVEPLFPVLGYYYWVRFLTYSGVYSPFNAAAGTYAEPATDPQIIIDLLLDQLTESQLAAALRERIDDIEATAVHANTLVTTVGTTEAAVQTRMDVLDGVSAQYMVKTDVNGYVAGYGLWNNGATSEFIVHADLFAVGKPGYAIDYPFIIGTVNGVTRIALNAATYIPDATITNAKIQSLAANKLYALSGTIADAVIGTGHIDNAKIGNFIQSNNYNSSTGIGWNINKNGTATFSGITIRDSSGNVILASGSGLSNSALIAGESAYNVVLKTNIAYDSITDMAADSKLTPQEKRELLRTWNTLAQEAYQLWISLDEVGLTADRDALRTAVDVLGTYLNGGASWSPGSSYVVSPSTWSVPAWIGSSIASTTTIVGSTFRTNFRNMSDALELARRKYNRHNINSYNKLTNANISTYIQSLAVDTLYLKGNAVTVPEIDRRTTVINGTGMATGEDDVHCSKTITLDHPGWVYAIFTGKQNYTAYSQKNSVATLNIAGATSLPVGGVSISPSICISDAAYLSAGTHTIKVYWVGEDSGVKLADRTLFVMGVKK